jgi:hypothetical protein
MLTTALSSSTPTWVSAKADSSFEHRYISTSIIPVRSIGLSLPGLTIDAHEVLMMFGRSCDVNVLNLWVLFSLDWFEQQPWPPPPQVQVLTEQSLDRVVVALEIYLNLNLNLGASGQSLHGHHPKAT